MLFIVTENTCCIVYLDVVLRFLYATKGRTAFIVLHGHVYQVEDDVVDCNTIQEEKCEQETVGYATQNKCTKWPR